jgi:DnaK suppressor protein
MEESLDLKFYKSLLIERKNNIQSNLSNLSKNINELQNLEVKDEGDLASVSSDSYTDNTIYSYQEEELEEIDIALSKLLEKPESYGICEMCGDDIGKARLEAKPFARYCRSCRDIVEQR